MADLYNLLQDDNLLHGEDRDFEEKEEEEDVENQGDWDREEREQVELRPEEGTTLTPDDDEHKYHASPTFKRGSAPDDETPLELEDLQQEGVVHELGRLYSKLKALWAHELLSPELLPYDKELVSSLVDAIADQEDAAAADASSQLRDATSTGNSNLDSLISSVIRVDASRCKFLLCSLIRERLRKLEEHPWHLHLRSTDRMSENEASYPSLSPPSAPRDVQEALKERWIEPESRDSYHFFALFFFSFVYLLSVVPRQAEYLKEYLALLERHLHRTVLDHFPPQQVWKTLDAPEMIDEPDLSSYVFCRVVAATVSIPNKGNDDDYNDVDEIGPGGEYEAGTCLIVRYSRVRRLFLQGNVELLI
jgi:hypothetical protein